MITNNEQRARWEKATRNTYDYAVVRQMLEEGYPVDDLCSGGKEVMSAFETALTNAIVSRDEPMVRLLLEFGADPNRVDNMESTPASYCCLGSISLAMMQILVEHGADMNKTSGYEKQPLLLMMMRKRSQDGLAYLLSCGADINQTDRKGETPLMAACAMRWDDLIEYAIHQGADTRLVDSRGRNAAQLYQGGPLLGWIQSTMQAQDISSTSPAAAKSGPGRRI